MATSITINYATIRPLGELKNYENTAAFKNQKKF